MLGLMFHVRSFVERDRSKLEAIYRDCRREAAWLPPTVKERSDFSRGTEDEVILVAVGHNDEPEGFISVWQPDGFIHHLYVRRRSREKGIGQALLDAVEERMSKLWRLKCLRANCKLWRSIWHGAGTKSHQVLVATDLLLCWSEH